MIFDFFLSYSHIVWFILSHVENEHSALRKQKTWAKNLFMVFLEEYKSVVGKENNWSGKTIYLLLPLLYKGFIIELFAK